MSLFRFDQLLEFRLTASQLREWANALQDTGNKANVGRPRLEDSNSKPADKKKSGAGAGGGKSGTPSVRGGSAVSSPSEWEEN